MILARILMLIPLALSTTADLSLVDSDADGLTDKLEQELLVKFAPRIMMSSSECDGLPAKFRPGSLKPQLLTKDGTIYGQVFRKAARGGSGSFIEIHYYHLWNRDCGRIGHALDVEHVSALLQAATTEESATAWKAEYWYAAAHEDTACDASHAIRSSFMNAEQQGPTVWISAGKHASFLDQEACHGGCGGDNCGVMRPLVISELINLGEQEAPMNGASWIGWPGWPMAEKMQTDFPEPVLAKLDAARLPTIVPINESQAPFKTAILVGGSAAGAQMTAVRKTGTGLLTTTDAVGVSMEKSTSDTGGSLKRAARAVWRALGGSDK
jgi:hypothetical protein